MQTLQDIFDLAVTHHKAKEYAQADAIYDRLMSEKEDMWPAICNAGILFMECGMTGKALVFLRRALELCPDNDEIMSNLGGIYRRLERKDEALTWYLAALKIKRRADTLSNLAGFYINEGDPAPAIQYADEALAMQAEHAPAASHKALALLELGRWNEGWAIYDARMDLPQYHRRPFTCPMWDGKPVKRLAIHGEQGLGDEVMFLTCLPQLRHLFDEVAIETNPRLVKLIQSSFPDAQVYSEHDDRPFEPDAYIPMGSLPGLCWPVQKNAYLKPTTTYPKNGKRIGISWKGGQLVTHGKLRNAPLEMWRRFLDVDAEVISLQYGPREAEAKELVIPHDSEGIADLDRLAAMIKSCDLVISVCNTTVHMAGALGVPCIVLTPAKPAWRYQLSGSRMPFYESPFMVRQGKNESWESVFKRAKDKAKEMLGHAETRRLPVIASAARA